MSSKWLVSTEWLAEHMNDPGLVIVDASWAFPEEGDTGLGTPFEEYLEERIPGAVFFDIDEIADHSSPELLHMAPPPEQFARQAGKLGIGDDSFVVVYDSYAPFAAPRAWWMLRLFGHDNVAVLDGGLEKWTLEGRPTEDGQPGQPVERTFTPQFRPGLLAGFEDVRRALEEQGAQVVDARSEGRYSGTEPEPYPGIPSGHMPGALNVHYESLLNIDNTIKPPHEIKAVFDANGVDLDKPVIFTCGSGVTACLPMLGAAMLGFEEFPLYDGSWLDWASRKDTPRIAIQDPAIVKEKG